MFEGVWCHLLMAKMLVPFLTNLYYHLKQDSISPTQIVLHSNLEFLCISVLMHGLTTYSRYLWCTYSVKVFERVWHYVLTENFVPFFCLSYATI